MTPITTPSSTDVRKRPKANSHSLIVPGNVDRHAALCEQLRNRQITDLVDVSGSGTGTRGWIWGTITDIFYYLFVWIPRTWWYTLTSLPQLVLDPIGLGSALAFAFVTTFALFGSLVVRYVCPISRSDARFSSTWTSKSLAHGN